MRNGAREVEDQQQRKSSIPITVRQLEAVVRISESLAKMEMKAFATDENVQEAIRLFTVSTLAAAATGDLAGAEGFTTEEDHAQMVKIERQIKRRFPVGTQIQENSILSDLKKQGFSDKAIYKVIHCAVRKGDFQYRVQRKMLFRLN